VLCVTSQRRQSESAVLQPDGTCSYSPSVMHRSSMKQCAVVSGPDQSRASAAESHLKHAWPP